MKEQVLQDRRAFFLVFLVAGFVMKIVVEFVHEVCGHGLFVVLFGGAVDSVHISVLWPYELSHISWSLPMGVTAAQMAWIYAGGILACLTASFFAQALLLVKRRIVWFYSLPLFWLAFWAFINSAGYLLIGGLWAFGDVDRLIELGVLTSSLSFFLGLLIFLVGFVGLSWILRRIFTGVFSPKMASLSVVFFWLLIPALSVLLWAGSGHSFQLAFLPLALLPVVASFALEYFLVLRKQGCHEGPDNVAEKQRCDQA